MHRSFAPFDVVPGNASVQRDNSLLVVPSGVDERAAIRLHDRAGSLAGPSDVGLHAALRLENRAESLTVAENVLGEALRTTSNRRHVFIFEENGVVLRNVCSLHGIGGELVDDVARCFVWMIEHLFSGTCARTGDVEDGCIGLYEDSVCADVAAEMTTASRIVRYVLGRVLVTFYSTDSLGDIAGVLVPDYIGDASDRKSLVTRLQGYHTSSSVQNPTAMILRRCLRSSNGSPRGRSCPYGRQHDGLPLDRDREALQDSLALHESVPTNRLTAAC